MTFLHFLPSPSFLPLPLLLSLPPPVCLYPMGFLPRLAICLRRGSASSLAIDRRCVRFPLAWVAGVKDSLLKTEIHATTRDIMKDIVHLILETNTFSAAVALVALFLFIGFPNTPYFGCAVIILPGVYANTLLATLNNRAIILRIQDQRSGGDCCEISDGEEAPELGVPKCWKC
ncbi:hypothetical protein B0H14DRAFT_3451431 [Mycena olivaceomarginata]|nr:hypothetical protein B0H14DRAFT_3451431 [Mycena olivaceomarginata]